MAQEIERKFLVTDTSWKQGAPVLIRQGYLSSSADLAVRVRIAGELAFITIKGATRGISRSEFEYSIPLPDAQAMLNDLAMRPLIEKRRYKVTHKNHLWEVDEFLGDNAGLVIAEVELDNPDDHPALPPWVGAEVSHDPRYYNANLAIKPFTTW